MFAPGVPLNQQNIGTTIRNPSTANLLISSKDRDNFATTGNPANFQISKKQNILSGFFTRIAPTEIVLDWCVDNINTYWNNSYFYIDISGTQYSIFVPNGQYTTAQALDTIVSKLNAVPALSNFTFSLTNTTNNLKALTCNQISPAQPQNFTIKSTSNSGLDISALASQLNFQLDTLGNNFPVDCPKILPTQYIDFICNQLTNNQALRDNSTSEYEQNIIYRWYFAWDVPEPVDAYGYPIYQGQKRFVQRRPIAFPKQIAWVPNQPIGNLQFQVVDDEGNILETSLVKGEMEWFATMLVSEN